MELANAVISLALVVKQQADDATENVALCQSLSSRAEMIPRLLDKFPDKSNLDEVLLSRIFEQLKSCHDLINQYRTKGAFMRFLKAGTMKNEFQDLENSLGKSIDDLTLAVGVSSAMVLDSIRNNFQQFFQKFNEEHQLPQAKDLQEIKEVDAPQVRSFMIPPSDIVFGMEIANQSFPQLLPLRSREGTYQNKQILIREYLISVKSSEVSELLSQVTPLLNFLSQVSLTLKESEPLPHLFSPVIGWGYTSSGLEQPSAAFPSTLITIFIASEVLPSFLPLTEFMKSHSSGHSDDEFLLRIGYSLIKNLSYFHSQCSLREKGELLHWPRGIFLHPRNLLIGQQQQQATVCLLLFDSFLPYSMSSSIVNSSSSSQRSEFFQFHSHSLSGRLQLLFPAAALSAGAGAEPVASSTEAADLDALLRDVIIWCAPEQMKALSLVTELTPSTNASEIYSFGLILSYLSTGRLPHDPLSPSLQELKEHVRQGKPQNIPHDGSILSEIISYCVAPNPTNRPDAMSLYRILFSLCQEKHLDVTPLPSLIMTQRETKAQKISAAAGVAGSEDEDDESESGLADFGDLADKVEQLSQSIKLFGSSVISSAGASSPSVGVTDSSSSSSGPVVVVYGQKVVLLNLPVVAAAAPVSQLKDEEDEEDEEEELHMKKQQQEQHSGVVIFHIDNTASMKKDNRMGLVKAMLLAVIPKYLQLNYLILVNSWSSTETTKGRIQVCRALNSMPSHLLERENQAAYEKFMEEFLFTPYLEPNGRTDLFGSCFQLFQQMEEELRCHHLPIYSIVLTDGTHNRLDYPLHLPKEKGEEYFGVYKATLNNGKKFGINPGVTFSVQKAEEFLKTHFDSLQSLCGELTQQSILHQTQTPVPPQELFTSLVIIGIGEASTQSLSSLANSLGERCSFYGITCTEEILPIFNSITESSGMEDRVTLSLLMSGSTCLSPSGSSGSPVSFSFRYLSETSDAISGCHVLSDQVLVEKLHHTSEISLSYKSTHYSLINSSSSSSSSKDLIAPHTATTATTHTATATAAAAQQKVMEIVKELVSVLSKLRDKPYEVTSDTFSSVFKKLQADKRVVTSLKLLYSSKKLRGYRHLSLYVGLGVWIREMDEMIESQIAAYRMNVETEMLAQLAAASGGDAQGGSGAAAATAAGGMSFQPSEVILERLQNNLRNTGRAVHKVSRHLTSIQTLRDRTLALATTLLSSELTLQRTSLGLQLNILHPRSGFHCAIDWSAADSEEVDLSLVETIQSALTTLPFAPSSAASPASPSSASHLDAHTQRLAQMFESDGGGGGARDGKEISFPCILFRANFDPFTIIRNSSLFTITSLFSAETSGYQFTPHCSAAVSVYCMEDIWDLLCFSSNQYLPGQDFPVTSSLCSNSSTAVALASLRNEKQLQQQHRPNMVMALGHTPLLFNLYLERSCLYQSCLNVTGDLMAFASTSYQWAKLFYDCFYFIHHITRSLSKRQRQSPSAATAAEAEAVGSSETKGEDSLPTAVVGAEEEEEEEKECLSPEERVSMIRRLRRTHVEVGLMALVSYSYACESKQTLPSKNTVLDMFSLSQTNASEAKATAAAGVGVGAESPYKIFSRDSLPGLTCPLAFSTLLATSSLYAFSNDPTVWNSLLLTLFSRFCEAISGNKIIRNQNPLVADLRELEESYRLCIGQIQTLFQRRLYVEWPKLDHTEKLHLISLCANDLNKILKTIVNTFLSEFSRYGLPLWSEMIALMETCLSLQRQRAAAGGAAAAGGGAATRGAATGGVACLRELYSHCDAKLNLVIDDLVSQASEQQQQQLCLPVVRQLQHSGAGDSDGDGDEWSLCLQEMDPQSDLEELLGYVEAILATKVSPKIEYKPVTKPQHPSINTSLNRELQFRVNSQPASWNTANPVVNIGLIGNVNSGKSTLCGRILYDLGIVDKHLVDRLSEEAKRMGYTADLRHAWLLDNLPAERSRNVTMVSKFKGFETSLRRYNLIDNPGHKDFLCSATEGIFQTDIALLVVSAVESERHISSLVTNFTEEFLINAFCYSIRHLIVIINKMDATSASASVSAAASASGGAPGGGSGGGSGGGEGSVSGGYAEAEYQAACESVKKHLKKAGYKINNSNTVQFVPISALRGVGIVSSSVEMPWYHGPCLLQLLDEVVIPKRQVEKPLRMIVSEVHKVSGVGVVLCGKVECGTVSVGDTLSCFPELHTSVPQKGKQRNNKKKTCAAAAAVTATALKAASSRGALLKVKSIEAHHVSLPSASAGDNIGIAISSSGSGSASGNEAISMKSFSKGMILTLSSAPPVPVFIHFEAQLILLKKITIHSGYCPTLLINSNHVPVKITRLLSLIDKNNSVLETFPASVTQSQICLCEMMAEKPFAAESIHELPKLSKFLIRQNRLIVAIGFIRGPVS